MAKERIARCPECGHDRPTKAQPRTVLRCPNCDEHYLAPPLSAPTDPPPPDPLPVASDDEMAAAGLLGPEVVRVDSVDFPPADPHPSAAGTDPVGSPDPETPQDAAPPPVPPPADPSPSPTEDPAGSPRSESPPRRRRRRYAGRW